MIGHHPCHHQSDQDTHVISPSCVIEGPNKVGVASLSAASSPLSTASQTTTTTVSACTRQVRLLEKAIQNGDNAVVEALSIKPLDEDDDDDHDVDHVVDQQDPSTTRRRVHFAPRLQKRRARWCRSDLDSIWYESEEIRTMGFQARRDAKRLVQEDTSYTDAVQDVFQDCSKASWGNAGSSSSSSSLKSSSAASTSPSSSTLCWEADSVRYLLRDDHHPRTLRGLESRIMPVLKTYRTFHAQSLLAVQAQRRAVRAERDKNSTPCTFSPSSSFKEESANMLRARSLQTSRPSRALARILAQADANEVASIVREELDRHDTYLSSSSSWRR